MKHASNPQAARRFAKEVVLALRNAGHESLWAGGCVRDELLGIQPADYDIATSATPDDVRRVFGFGRTLAIGAAFGVITVRGPREAGFVEVATFRQDAEYSDGRRPDAVHFSSAEEDAKRRDFTINGLFYDPLEKRVIDYVGGRDDLAQRRVRAIGDPHQRIAEDKLRMLRGVRFAATFSYELETETFLAIRRHAADIHVVSGERIGVEMSRMLAHPTRAQAAEILREAGLWPHVLPESNSLIPPPSEPPTTCWNATLAMLTALQDASFPAALAIVLRETLPLDLHQPKRARAAHVRSACRRWRLANDIVGGVQWLLENEDLIRNACDLPWPRVQRILAARRAEELLAFCAAVAQTLDSRLDHVDFCREKMRLPHDVLNPQPLISGADLTAMGAAPGPLYAKILTQVRDAQLLDEIDSPEAARSMAESLLKREQQ